MDVETEGIFRPKLVNVIMAAIDKNSSATDSVMSVGDTIIEIEGCVIPRCSALVNSVYWLEL